MPDNIKIIQDISLLYELSLSVGSSLDPEENCHRFLRTLISRKSLNFGSVWLNQPNPEGGHFCRLFFIHPHFRESETTVTCSHFIVQALSNKPYLSVSSQDPHFADLAHEKKIGKGAYAIFKLGDLGFLKLFASNRPNGFEEIELAQLKQVVDKLKISLDGCFAHVRLKQVTENQQLTQRALAESEQKLRRIIDSSLDAVVSADENGLAIEWNAQAEKMFGYTRQEVLGKRLRDLFIPERHWPQFQATFEDYLRTTNKSLINTRYEIKCIRKDGTEFLAELSTTADIKEKNILFVGFVRDITAQRKAKKEIEQARNRMETLISNLQTGILLEDENRHIALVNQAFCDIFSIPAKPEDLVGQDCSQAAEQSKHLFADPELFVQSIHQALRDKRLVENEVFVMACGKILERNFIPLFSGDVYEGHLWQYRDVTERQNTERTIRESEEKYRGVLENMDLGLLEVDLNDNILRANNSFCQMLGYSQEELIGQKAKEKLMSEPARKFMDERLLERRNGLSSVYEIQMQRKDGSPIWGLISGAPIKNAQGQIVGSIGIQFDLTDRKKLENELAEAKQVADRARLAERQFLTHMSHEIRTPINAVIGMTHLLEETQPDAIQRDYLNSLRFSADSLLGIIDNILDLSKIDAGEIEFEQKPFDLTYLLKSLLQTIQFKIVHKDLRILEDIDPSIKNLVLGDPTRLNQILTNLLGNALKFTEKGEISLSAQVIEQSEHFYQLEFRVRDTGIGIPEDKRETIFEYFKQADVQINRKFGGTGLGLTIVKQLVELMGGTIRVESELGQGSDFIFTLRLGNSGIPLSDHELALELDKQQVQNFAKGLHFLIVEDNLLNQKLICKTILTWECTYEVANNGLEALKKTANTRFDVILMDIHMPELDGCETTIAIRKDGKNPNKNVPILALTAAAMSDEKRKAVEAGMNGFLTKPIAPKLLQSHILQAIQEIQPIGQVGRPMAIPSVQHMESEIDLRYLLNLSNGDTAFVAEIIGAFLVESPVALQQLQAAMQQQDWIQCGKLLHKIKPNFAMLGMKKLEEKAAFIEDSIKKGDADASILSALILQLIAHTQELMPLLLKEKAGLNR